MDFFIIHGFGYFWKDKKYSTYEIDFYNDADFNDAQQLRH